MGEKPRHEEEPIQSADMAEPTEQAMRVERIVNPDEAMVNKIFDIETACFPPEMMEASEEGISPRDELREVLETKGVHVLIEDAEGPFGHISAVDHDTQVDFMKEYDPEYKPQKDTLYINSLDIMQGRNQQEGLERPKALEMLWEEFKKEAIADGYKTATMYARPGESRVAQRKLGAKYFRTMPNWLDMGEDFDYLEISLVPQVSEKEK